MIDRDIKERKGSRETGRKEIVTDASNILSKPGACCFMILSTLTSGSHDNI